MDLRFSDAQPTDAEHAVINATVPASETVEEPGRVVRGGHAARDQRHQLLPVLAAVQAEIGHVSEGALMEICRRLVVPPAEAYGVASFYALISLEPRPPRVAHLCDDVGCAPFGGEDLIAEVADRLGPAGTDADGVTWERSPCLGQCDRAPAAYLQLAGEDDQVVVGADARDADHLVARLRDGAVDAATSIGLPQQDEAGLKLLRRVGVVDPASLDSHRDHGGGAALDRALELGPAGVRAEVTAANLRGRGGAAFPAAVKFDAVAGAAGPDKHVICNADESEPGTFKDRVLLEGDPFRLIEAMTVAGYATGARHGYIYLRGEYPVAARRLERAIAACRGSGLLGDDVAGAGFAFDVELRRGQGAYICGEETALMESIEGYRGEPRNKPPFPTDAGLFGQPTLINNVETLFDLTDIVVDGGASFAGVGTPDSTGHRLFCLSGAIAEPGVYEVALGTTLGELLELAGGIDGELGAILLGGAAGSFVTADHLDLPLTFEAARDRGLALGSGVVMPFDAATDLGRIVTRIAAFFRDETCGQCVPCRVGVVRQEESLARYLADGRDPVELELLEDIDRAMTDASICGLGQTAASAVRSAIRQELV
ncbi:MAG: NAD(P)H-dependent oxidoreductase subunit E [Nitriliruptoraceae bacterium]